MQSHMARQLPSTRLRRYLRSSPASSSVLEKCASKSSFNKDYYMFSFGRDKINQARRTFNGKSDRRSPGKCFAKILAAIRILLQRLHTHGEVRLSDRKSTCLTEFTAGS
jgi:hypothetical protein